MLKLSPDAMRYMVWSAAVVLGALLAFVDRQLIGRWVFGFLLLASVGGGLLLTVVSPFRFGGTSHYMEGVIISAGSALGLAGYILAFGLQSLWARVLQSRK